MLEEVTSSEAARHDLYNGLNELLGPERAETLMAALPAYDTSDLVTKSDLMVFGAEMRSELRAEISEFRADAKSDIASLRGELSDLGTQVGALETRVGALGTAVAALQESQAGIHLRLDRLFLALVAGLIVIVGAMAGVVFMP